MGNTINAFGKLEDNYFVQKVKLGEGAFGTVWRGVEKKTDETVAIKQLKKQGANGGRNRQDYEHEVSIMKRVKHENVLQFRAAFEDQRGIWLVLDYCDGGDLGDQIASRQMSTSAAASWMAQVCAAIGAMHSAGVVHRDVKPDNFMISNGVLKLADFGLADVLPNEGKLTQRCGTPAFMAPEQHDLINSGGYGMAVDMWAAGVILHMMLNGGRHPFF
jgi:serine/threonine protein kinase